jgi:hypothetical protein
MRQLRDCEVRHKTENEMAAEVRAQPGQILIYAPPLDMNLKWARVNVYWKGNVQELEAIDDPVVTPKLEATRKAHKELWAIRLLTHPSLSDAQCAAARAAFDRRFLWHGTSEIAKAHRREANSRLIRHHAAQRDDLPPLTPKQREKAEDMIFAAMEEARDTYQGGSLDQLVTKAFNDCKDA